MFFNKKKKDVKPKVVEIWEFKKYEEGNPFKEVGKPTVEILGVKEGWVKYMFSDIYESVSALKIKTFFGC